MIEAPSTHHIGIDLGGSKISAILMDGAGAVLKHLRLETPKGDYTATCDAIVNLIADLKTSIVDDETTVGVGIPGSRSPVTGHVRNANSTCLNGNDLKRDLEKRLSRPIRIANDADCFAISEATDGAGRGRSLVWGLIVGTGCGSGIVVDGKLLSGPLAIAGEWGHNPLPNMTAEEQNASQECWCGRKNCIETWVSGPALQRDHHCATGQRLSAREISEAAERGDLGAQATLDRYVSRLARAMAGVINILDPDLIVIGGGLGQIPYLYRALPIRIAPLIFSDSAVVDIRPPQWGDDSGVRGAARLWNTQT